MAPNQSQFTSTSFFKKIILCFGELTVRVWVNSDVLPCFEKPYSYFSLLDDDGCILARKWDIPLSDSAWAHVISIIFLDVLGVTSESLRQSKIIVVGQTAHLMGFRSRVDTQTPQLTKTGHHSEGLSTIDTDQLLDPNFTTKFPLSAEEIRMRLILLPLNKIAKIDSRSVQGKTLDISIVPQEVLFLLGIGEASGLVIDLGHFYTHVVPIVDGRCINSGFGKKVMMHTIECGGADVTLTLAKSAYIFDSRDENIVTLRNALKYRAVENCFQYVTVDRVSFAHNGVPYIRPDFEIWNEIKEISVSGFSGNVFSSTDDSEWSFLELKNPDTLIITLTPGDQHDFLYGGECTCNGRGCLRGGEYIVIPGTMRSKLYDSLYKPCRNVQEQSTITCKNRNSVAYRISNCTKLDNDNKPGKIPTGLDFNVVDFVYQILTSPEFSIDFRNKMPLYICGGGSLATGFIQNFLTTVQTMVKCCKSERLNSETSIHDQALLNYFCSDELPTFTNSVGIPTAVIVENKVVDVGCDKKSRKVDISTNRTLNRLFKRLK